MMVLIFLNYEKSEIMLIYAFQLLFTMNFTYLIHADANMEKILNRLEYFNELCFILMLHVMMFFVQRNQLDPIVMWDAGSATIAIIGTMFLFNFVYLAFSLLVNVCKRAKLVHIRRMNLRKMRLSKFRKPRSDKPD